jgi:hypothetical protein
MINERQLSMRCLVVEQIFRFFVFQLENSSTGKPFNHLSSIVVLVKAPCCLHNLSVEVAKAQSRSVLEMLVKILVNSQRFPVNFGMISLINHESLVYGDN